MVCCGRRVKNIEKRYKKNVVVPQKVNAEYIQKLNREVILCGGCDKHFNLGSDELKIHCNHCNQFFHCKIAGRCMGDDCKIITDDNTIHRASYCYNCIGKLLDNKTCLCKDCYQND
tara:strand:+ start:1385 stop:1732 length:348 start_codon:yes stop_codon:yes gene_type:complete